MKTKGKQKRPVPARKVLDRLIGGDRKHRARIDEQKLNVRIAEMIYEAREAASLSQAELAKLIGTTQSVISKLEDADYEGHSLSMLKRIGGALHKRLDVRFLPEPVTR